MGGVLFAVTPTVTVTPFDLKTLAAPVFTENSSSGVVVMKSAQDAK